MAATVVLGSISPGDVRARVEIDTRGRDSPRDLAAFVPMVVVSVMRASRNARDVAPAFVSVVEATADLLLNVGADDARELRLRDRLGAGPAAGELGSVESMIGMGI